MKMMKMMMKTLTMDHLRMKIFQPLVKTHMFMDVKKKVSGKLGSKFLNVKMKL